MLRDLTKKVNVPSFTKWVSGLSDKLFNCVEKSQYSEETDLVKKCKDTSTGGEEKRCKLSKQQMQALMSLHYNKYNIIKGYRHAGLSTMLRLNALYNILYKESDNSYNVLFILNSKECAKYEKDMFLNLLVLCDEYLVMTDNDSSKIELLFDNRHITVEFISQEELIRRRGKEEKINDINVDNAAFIEDKEISDSIAVLAKQTNARVSIASIPNGESGLFYETWRDSLLGTAPFKMSSLKWYLDDRFNTGLKGSSGLQSYDIDNIGMMFEALENHDMITNDWYEKWKTILGTNAINEIDGEFNTTCYRRD